MNTQQVNNTAGRLKYFIDRWKQVTQDQFVLEAIQGYEIDFEYQVSQFQKPMELKVNNQGAINLEITINRLLSSNAIEECDFTEGQYLSSFFLVPKPDGSYRFILNLKGLNHFIRKEHFKIEDLRMAINLLDRDMCRLDLKDAYLPMRMIRNFSGLNTKVDYTNLMRYPLA